MKEFISLTIVAMEIGKRQFFSYHCNGCYEEKKLQNLNLLDSKYHFKNWVDWISAEWDKTSQPQKYKFLEKRHGN